MLIPRVAALITCVLIGLAAALSAHAAVDPTQPPFTTAEPENGDNVAAPIKPKSAPAKPKRKAKPIESVADYRLNALVHSSGEQTAYVNNQLHKVGDRLGSYKISVIDTDHIHLRHGGSEWRIDLYQRILKIK